MSLDVVESACWRIVQELETLQLLVMATAIHAGPDGPTWPKALALAEEALGRVELDLESARSIRTKPTATIRKRTGRSTRGRSR